MSEAITRDVKDLVSRVGKLETWKEEQQVITALNKDKLDRIDGHLVFLIKLVIGAIATGIMAFILNGGLALTSDKTTSSTSKSNSSVAMMKDKAPL